MIPNMINGILNDVDTRKMIGRGRARTIVGCTNELCARLFKFGMRLADQLHRGFAGDYAFRDIFQDYQSSDRVAAS